MYKLPQSRQVPWTAQGCLQMSSGESWWGKLHSFYLSPHWRHPLASLQLPKTLPKSPIWDLQVWKSGFTLGMAVGKLPRWCQKCLWRIRKSLCSAAAVVLSDIASWLLKGKHSQSLQWLKPFMNWDHILWVIWERKKKMENKCEKRINQTYFELRQFQVWCWSVVPLWNVKFLIFEWA